MKPSLTISNHKYQLMMIRNQTINQNQQYSLFVRIPSFSFNQHDIIEYWFSSRSQPSIDIYPNFCLPIHQRYRYCQTQTSRFQIFIFTVLHSQSHVFGIRNIYPTIIEIEPKINQDFEINSLETICINQFHPQNHRIVSLNLKFDFWSQRY